MMEELQESTSFFDRFTWEDYILAAVIFIVFIIFAIHIAGYTQVPSPVYGGDLYRDRGFVNNIVAGNPVWSDGFYANELQYYPYLVFAVQALIVKVTGLSVNSVFLIFPLLTLIAAAWVWYALGHSIFKSKKWGLVTVLAFLSLLFNINPKGAQVALFVFIPAFILYWIKYEQDGKTKHAIFSGVFLGLTGLTWGGIFIASCAMIGLTLLYFYIADILKNKKYFETLWVYIKKYYFIFAIAIALFLIFLLPLAIKYHLHEVNEVTKWGDTKIELLGPSWVFRTLKDMFFSTASFFSLIISLIALVGLGGMIIAKKSKEVLIVLSIFIANILTIQHHLISKPLFNAWFLPEKLVYIQYLVPFFVTFGVIVLYQQLKNPNAKKIGLGIVMILFVVMFVWRFNQFKNDQWEQVGRADPTYINALSGLGNYLEEHMAKDQTVLSNDESGFMLAVLSGRKVMITRRTHASYYIDIDQRIADAVIVMYGNDTEFSKNILKKYNVQYFYVDQQLFQYPMRVRADLKEYLTEHGIQFTEMMERYDIAVPPERANLRDLLIIPPQNLSTSFTGMLSKAYTVSVSNQVVGELYKINY
jgi:hypothetical protein